MSSIDPPWWRLARAQHGMVSRQQLLTSGLTTTELNTHVRKGNLHRSATGVYRVTGAVESFEARVWCAVLATGGVVRSTTAAYLWQMVDRHQGPILIAIPRSARLVRVPEVRTFRRDLGPASVLLRNGIPVVSRPIALMDHLTQLSPGQGLRLLDRALQQRWLGEDDLRSRLSRPLKGNVRLREIVAGLAPGAEAESERRLHSLLRSAGLTGWTANFRLRDGARAVGRADVAFVRHKLAIEVDGFAYHSGGDRFQQDRTKQNDLVRLGWTVLRFTWADIVERPAYVLATIRATLAACGAL